MARAEARILVSIWSDPDFLALSPEAQRAYMFLLSQPDLEYSGVIPLRVRKWAGKAASLTPAIVGEALRELERTRFIVADRETEELLVRTFIRGDEVYRQPNLLRAARKHLANVESVRLLGEVEMELLRVLPLAEGKAKTEVEGMLEDLAKRLPKGSANPSPNPSENPSPEGAPNPAENPSSNPLGDRGVVTEVEMVSPSPSPRKPLAPSPDPLPLASLAGAVSRDEASAQTLVGEWLDRCKTRPHSRTVGAVAKHVKAMLDEDMPADAVRVGLEAWRAKGADPSTLYGFVNQAANAEPRGSPGNGGKSSTTDDRVNAGLALAAELERKGLTA